MCRVLDVEYYRQPCPPGIGGSNKRKKWNRRRRVLQRDGFMCVGCGSREDLTMHHRIPRSRGGQNRVDNLTTLCLNCHATLHAGAAALSSFRLWLQLRRTFRAPQLPEPDKGRG